jgi:hypothetical protein
MKKKSTATKTRQANLSTKRTAHAAAPKGGVR